MHTWIWVLVMKSTFNWTPWDGFHALRDILWGFQLDRAISMLSFLFESSRRNLIIYYFFEKREEVSLLPINVMGFK